MMLGETLHGLPVKVSLAAVERKQVGWNFKPSRYRSKRLHKKLLKRFGTQERFMEIPAAFMLTDPLSGRKTMFIHPEAMKELRRVVNDRRAW